MDENDMDWLKAEIGGIKKGIGEISEHLQDIDNRASK
jgi:archaellum component FlaC